MRTLVMFGTAAVLALGLVLATKTGAAAATSTAASAATASSSATSPVRYLGLADDEETRFDATQLAGLVKVSKVRTVTWAEFGKLAGASSDHEFHGRWLYFSVKIDRDVPLDPAAAGQAVSVHVTVTERYRTLNATSTSSRPVTQP